MPDKPILFSGSMVRALIAGRKRVTRRVIKTAPSSDGSWHCDRVGPTGFQWTGAFGIPRIPFTPRFRVGDRLWVRETFGIAPDGTVRYVATEHVIRGRKPAIHMPRINSRITLHVTYVTVQRLQDIREEQAEDEGVDALDGSHRAAFAKLWNELNGISGPFTWSANPWVEAVSFTVELSNIDAAQEAA